MYLNIKKSIASRQESYIRNYKSFSMKKIIPFISR